MIKELGVGCDMDPAIIQNYKRILECEYTGSLDIKTGYVIHSNIDNEQDI